jgi:hypothetical protein
MGVLGAADRLLPVPTSQRVVRRPGSANRWSASRGIAVGREQWGQICPFDKSLAGPKALRIDRSGPWYRVVNLTRLPLFGPSGNWGGGLESVTQRRLSGI